MLTDKGGHAPGACYTRKPPMAQYVCVPATRARFVCSPLSKQGTGGRRGEGPQWGGGGVGWWWGGVGGGGGGAMGEKYSGRAGSTSVSI